MTTQRRTSLTRAQGARLGGSTPYMSPNGVSQPKTNNSEELRRLKADAADKRISLGKGRGMGDPNIVDKLDLAGQRALYLGKITTHYDMRKEEVPLGLNLLSLEKLKEHYQGLVMVNRKEGIINRNLRA